MNIIESLLLAIEALRANKLRAGLTMLGVVIGVTSVILLVAIAQGAERYIYEQFTGMGTNVLIITSGKTETHGHGPAMSSTTHKLSYTDSLAVKRRCPSLDAVTPMLMGSGQLKYGSLSRNCMVLGVGTEWQQIHNFKAENGSFFSEADVDAGRRVCAIGWTVKEELFGNENPLGKFLSISGTKFRIIGIMEKKGTSFGFDMDDLVFIPTLAAQRLFNTDRLFSIRTTTRGSAYIEEAKKEITEVMKKQHGGEEDFSIVTQADMLTTLDKILNMLTYVLIGIASISLIVGGIGIMNIMLVSVRERTREIGIRKAVGARRSDILVQFLLESVTLSCTGGIVGILLGAGIATAVTRMVSYLPTLVSFWSVSLAFSFSVMVGVFFGVYPAYKASVLNPIEALRYE